MSVVADTRAIPPFETLPTIDGYDVIDRESGRPVAHRDTLRSANGVAFRLNEFARGSTRAKALTVGVRLLSDRPEASDDPLDYDPWAGLVAAG